VSWGEYHSKSERLAAEAEIAFQAGDGRRAEELYRKAATDEAAALSAVGPDKPRTLGITAVSAVALWYKGRDFSAAERLAHELLAQGGLPPSAREELRELLYMLWTASAAERAGIRFMRGDVLVSVKGGDVIHGGAPLDLIMGKVETIQSVLFRTVEMLLGRPLRRRGGPPNDIQLMFRPWLFQAPAGSYQFAVRMREPEQMELYRTDRPKVEGVTATFFDVLRAAASGREGELSRVVPDREYRGAFLSLSRGLAPTGKTFSRLEVRDASRPTGPQVAFATETRQELNRALRMLRPPDVLAISDKEEEIRGVLRGLQLDKDWLEVRVDAEPGTIHVGGVGEVLDDVVGAMVNHRVVVNVLRRANSYLLRDIQLDE